MQLRAVSDLLGPLIKSGHEWQYIDINGSGKRPRFYFSGIQYTILFISTIALLQLPNGISEEIIGYVIAAFGISVSLFMSLLVSIFDKFENTDFSLNGQKTEDDILRLKQKKNFFKRFISITSYLVVLSILIIVLSSFTYLFDLSEYKVRVQDFKNAWQQVDVPYGIKCMALLLYRVVLNYFLLNYLFLTLFVAGSAYEYYMAEMVRRHIE